MKVSKGCIKSASSYVAMSKITRNLKYVLVMFLHSLAFCIGFFLTSLYVALILNEKVKKVWHNLSPWAAMMTFRPSGLPQDHEVHSACGPECHQMEENCMWSHSVSHLFTLFFSPLPVVGTLRYLEISNCPFHLCFVLPCLNHADLSFLWFFSQVTACASFHAPTNQILGRSYQFCNIHEKPMNDALIWPDLPTHRLRTRWLTLSRIWQHLNCPSVSSGSSLILDQEALNGLYPDLLSTAIVSCNCEKTNCDSVYWFRTIFANSTVQFLGRFNNADVSNHGTGVDASRFIFKRKNTVSFMLRIINVTKEDTGVYSCVLRDRKNTEVWKSGSLLLPGGLYTIILIYSSW